MVDVYGVRGDVAALDGGHRHGVAVRGGGVDANDIALVFEEWPAGVAGDNVGVELDDGNVGPRIGTDDRCLVGLAGGRDGDGDLGRAFDDVVSSG
jgi:hypothetical protein